MMLRRSLRQKNCTRVGQFYEDFSQTTDEELRRLLSETNHHDRAAAA